MKALIFSLKVYLMNKTRTRLTQGFPLGSKVYLDQITNHFVKKMLQ